MRTRDKFNFVIEGEVVKVYKSVKGETVEILLDKDVFKEIEEKQYCLSIVSAGYVSVAKREKKKYIFRMLLHRFVMGAGKTVSGADDTIDHIDRNKLNNLRSNLREATHHENVMNKALAKNNKTGVRGVYWYKATGQYKSHVQYKGKKVHVGYFNTLEEAERAVKAKRAQLFGEFAGV